MTEEPPRNPPPPDIDPEQLRQFQEFQRFQQSQGPQALPPGTPTPPPPPPAPAPPPRKPLWQVLLGSKLVRRLILLLIVVLVGMYFYEQYFGSDDSGDVAQSKGGKQGNQTAPSTPFGINGTVGRLYSHVSQDISDRGCLLFADDGVAKKEFAQAFGAPDCESAIHALKKQVTNVDLYQRPKFPDSATGTPSGSTAVVSSCEMEVSGGPRLGKFTLTKLEPSGSWIITGYEAEPAC